MLLLLSINDVAIIFYAVVSGQNLPLKVIANCLSKADQREILSEVLQLLQSEFNVNSIGLAMQHAAASCSELFTIAPLRKPGLYWIRNGASLTKMFCEK